MKGLIGLGNFGYGWSRHNAGMKFIDYAVSRLSSAHTYTRITRFSYIGTVFDTKWNDQILGMTEDTRIVLAKPISFMNNCGKKVQRISQSENINHLCIVHDDLELPFGSSKLKHKGSANGHNGLKSIMKETARADFTRIRIGIGRPQTKTPEAVSEYVLANFTQEEQEELTHKIFPDIYSQIFQPE